MNAKIIIGANYGDEGKGTIVANYTKKSKGKVLNVLTNGGAQRGHSILTKDGNITYKHFGAGTYYGADNYFSQFFILNPMQFVIEYNQLLVKPNAIFRHPNCKWTTPFDSMANLISEQQKNRHASCCMGIWNTIKRYKEIPTVNLDTFINYDIEQSISYLLNVKKYYERNLSIPNIWKDIWNDMNIIYHFIEDSFFLFKNTIVCDLKSLNYDEIIFENGQGLLLSDNGIDSFETTPSNTGITYPLFLIKDLNVDNVTAHYVTRPYLTRHGDGILLNQSNKSIISSSITDDRNNHYNEFQGKFRYGHLDISELFKRISNDSLNVSFNLEVTHCDEMDRSETFKKYFNNVNFYDTPLI